MKYLKLFDSKSEDTFEEITYPDFIDAIYGEAYCPSYPSGNKSTGDGDSIEFRNKNWVEFTQQEILEINKSSGLKMRISLHSVPQLLDCAHSLVDDDQHTFIYKLQDDWYYLIKYGQSRYYKCDQFAGLLDCLKIKPVRRTKLKSPTHFFS